MKGLRISKTGKWELRLSIPSDVRSALGKREFKKSLGHLTKQEAEIQAGLILSQWKSLILTERQRNGSAPPSSNYDLSEFSERRREHWHWARKSLSDMAGIEEPSEEQIIQFLKDQLEDSHDIVVSSKSVAVTFSPYCYTVSFLEQYTNEKLKLLEPRSRDEHLTVLKNQFIKSFPILDKKFTFKKVQQWWDNLQTGDNAKSPSTIRKYRSHCRSYMNWLIKKGFTNLPNHFDQLEHIPKKEILKDQRKRRTERKPFTDSDLAKIWKEINSKKKPDQGLSDLFLFAIYTGCRIEEICNFKSDDIRQTLEGRYYIEVTVSKTDKGRNRYVPLHHNLIPLIEGRNGYIVNVGKVNNRYGERSSAIGKKFGRIKDQLGYGRDKVFHSIRKSFTDKLKQAGVPEHLAADILGHEIQTMSYGVYASDAPVEQLIPLVDLVSYPELEELL
jgi:integrase